MFLYLLQAKVIDMKDTVVAMCRANLHVWVMLENGKLSIINTCSFKIEHQINKTELNKNNLVDMITVDDYSNLVTVAYKDGTVAFMKSSLRFNSHHGVGEMNSLAFGILEEVDFKHENIKFFVTNVSSSKQLYAVEACKPQESEQVELWCGGDKGIIEIFIPHTRTSQAQLKTVLKTHTNSPKIPKDASIIQLKSSVDTIDNMYALHNHDSIISFWKTGEQPILISVIKPSQLSSPGID